jgi:hypothetical protein
VEAVLALTFVAIAAAGLVVGRRTALLLALVAWPAIYGAMAAGVIGSGLGDNWWLGAGAITLASVAVTAGTAWLGSKRIRGGA